MVTYSHSQLSLITEKFSIGFALKHPVRDRDCCKLGTRTCWSLLNNVSDGRFDLPLDIDFLSEVKIPVIVVFTKYDLLVVDYFRACHHISSLPDRKVEAKERAKRAFNEFTKQLKFPFVPVSTRKEYGQLIKSVTSLFPLK
jgi:hypothetical protein